MKQSGHLKSNVETGTRCPSLQSMEGDIQINRARKAWLENVEVDVA